ncbi:MAG TPA: amino acid--[acyl-carrier-protein] ligase [Angustibacter sp.]|nr:amino acid--[acyl-carrier-protein] ligase [Angustibacter sp.]
MGTAPAVPEAGSTSARQAFRGELLDAGLLVDTGVPGLYLRSGDFEDVVQALDRYVTRLGEADRDQVPDQPRPWRLALPPVLARSVFERTDYLASFPHLIGAVSTFGGDDRAHAQLLTRHASGEDWTDCLQPTQTMLVPAACHAVYPQLTGGLPEGGRLVDVLAYCFRHEPSGDPARMQAFRMREFVRVGTPEEALAHRNRWARTALEALLALDLEAQQVVANDPFFGRAGRLLAVNQRDDALKFEIEVALFGADEPGTAVASSNYHQTHFGVNFAISTADGEPAHSACVGFGLERITLALLRRHGLDVGTWPSSVRGLLWP